MTVTALSQAPRARRARASLARTLADAAGLHGTERELFALLVRLSYRPGPVARRRAWLAEHLGVHPVTVARAVAALEAAELITVAHGTGRTTSTYTLDLPALVTRLTPPVHPAEPTPAADTEGLQIATPGVANRYPCRSESLPQGLQIATPLRARDARDAREIPDSYQYPLTPSAPERRADLAGGTPPGTPRPGTEDETPTPAVCAHGRTARQGCRTCGTDTRTREKASRRAAEAADRARREAERAAARAAEAELRPAPADFRHLIDQARKEPR